MLPEADTQTCSMYSLPTVCHQRDSANFYDIHSTSENSCGIECIGHDDNGSDPDTLMKYGDVVTMDTDGNGPMEVRMAGAGLRHGVIGSNNAFQVRSYSV